MPTQTPSSSPAVLERRLSPFDAAAIIVANVIGGGILFRSPAVAAAIPDAMWFLLAWVAGGVLAFMGAMAYAELAALRPKAGGEYVYLREAYGPLAGFLTGWTSFVAGFSGAIAASAVFFIVTLDRFVPGIANGAALLAIPVPLTSFAVTFSIHTLAASGLIVLFALIHIVGVGPGRAASNGLTTLKIVAFVVFIVFGLTAGTGSPSNLTQSVGPVTLTGWMFAMIPVMFTYSGWNAASYMAEEIRDPGRNVPKALILGTAGVIVIYLLINVLYLYVVPIGELAATQGSVLDVVADRLLGQRAGNVMAVVAMVSLAAGINAWTFAGPRVYFAMARDGLFFKSAARVHPKYKTPAASIIAQAAFSILLVLTGSLDSIANYVGFAITLFAGTAVAAIFVLRAREPQAPRPYRAWGYPVTPAIFVLVSAAIVLNALYTDPLVTGAGAAIILAGVPLYYYFKKAGASRR
ncbi:MAG TPA: amino acid permease [Vicinamibacterales bacterium]|nr:amino acid permease [Vicinamibacterales bacterium]